MNILLGLLPFIAFALLAGRAGVATALWIAAAIAVAQALRARFIERKAIKVLEAGAAVLFVALAVVASFLRPGWSVFAVRTLVDVGLVAIAGGSILLGRPFTLQYAKETVPEERWSHPMFYTANRNISAVWTLAFVVEAVMSACVAWVPGVPPVLAIAVNVAAIAGAIWFTTEYPKRLRARAGVR